jgi:thermitase
MKKTISLVALIISAQLMYGQLTTKALSSNTLQGLRIQKAANGQMTTQLKDGATATIYWSNSTKLSTGRYKVSYLVKHPESEKPLRIDETWDDTNKKLINTSEIAGNELIVTLKPNKTATELISILINVGAQIEHHIPNSNIFVISFSADEPETMDNIISYLENKKETIESITKNRLYRLDALPNDPQMDWGLFKIQTPDAWNVTTGSMSVLIGIADTGTDIEHPDLKANIWINPGEDGIDQNGNNKATNGIDDDNNGYIDDIHGYDFVNHTNNVKPDISYTGSYHGTHVAGTVAATGNNGIGVVGVNWNASIVTLKIAGNSLGAWESASKESMIYAASVGCQVINNSWGMTSMYDDETIDETRKRFADYERAGGIAVFSAGNDNTDNDGTYTHYPSAYPFPNIVAVGASNSTEKRASFSCYGKKSVDVFAPGEDILSTLPTYNSPSGYGLLSGTSMSAPYVTGLFGLLKSAHPELTMFQIRDAIFNSVDKYDNYKDICSTGGRINANKALAALNGMTTPSKPLAPVIEKITQPSGSTYEGAITISGLPTGNWVIYSENQIIRVTGKGNIYTLKNIEPGVYQFYVMDSLGLSTPFTNSIEIKMNPSAPNPPSVNSLTITDCYNYLARIDLENLPAMGKWTIKTKALDPTTNNWIITKDSIKGSGRSAQVLNLPAGSYKFAVKPENGCISPYSNTLLITEKPSFDPIQSKVIKRKCNSTNPESIYLKFNNLKQEQLYSITQSKINPTNNTVEKLATYNLASSDTCFTARNIEPGNYLFLIKSNIGCTSDSLKFTLYPPTSTVLGTPNIVKIIQPSDQSFLGKITISNLPKTGKYKINLISLDETGKTMSAFSSGETTTFAGIIPGKYVASVIVDSSLCESNPSTEFIILPNPSAITKPVISNIIDPLNCYPYGSVTLCNLPTTQWKISEISGKKSVEGSGSCATIDTLSVGTYIFIVTNQYGQASDTVTVRIHESSTVIPAIKIKTIIQPNVSNRYGTIQLAGLTGIDYVVNLMDNSQLYRKKVSDDELIINYLEPGHYKYASLQFSGGEHYCFTDSTELITIDSLPNEAVFMPTIKYIYQPSCSSPKGSIDFSDLPTDNWVLRRKPDNITINGKGKNYTLTNISSGIYSFSVENKYGYSSPWTEDVTIQKGPTRPLTPQIDKITHPTSTTHTGSVLLKGIYIDPFYNQASITQYPDMRSYTVYHDTITISNLLPGKYFFKLNGNYSSCESDTTAQITINPLPDDVVLTPTVYQIIHPQCDSNTGSVVLQDLPTKGTWTITRYPDNTKYIGQGTSFTVTNLASGTYYFKATNQAGYTSARTNDITINAPRIKIKTPTIALISQPTNTSKTGSVLLTNIDRSATGYIILLPENTSFYVTGSQQTITNIPPGKHTLYFSSYSSTFCDSDPTNILTINPAPISNIPDAPNVDYVNQPSCYTATASVQISDLPKTGEWTITMNPGNIINAGSGTTTTISDILPGVYTFTVTNSSGYTSLSSNSVTIQSQASKAPTPIVDNVTQPTLEKPLGTVVLTGLPSNGMNYVHMSSSSSSYYSSILVSGTTCTIKDLEPDTYTFYVQNYSFSCQSDYTKTVAIDLPANIVLTPIPDSTYQTETSCNTGTRDIQIKNLPYKGYWTLTRYPDFVSIKGSGKTTTIYDLTPGTYWFSVTNSSGVTSSPSKEVTILNTTKSEIPIISQVKQPTSNNSNGSVLLSNLTPNTDYEIVRSYVSNSSSYTSYNYYSVDYTGTVLITNLYSGKYYFRARELKYNNCESDPTPFVILDNPNGIDNIQQNSKLKLFPNPVENQLTIERQGGVKSNNYQIINAQGEIITTGILEDMLSLSLSHLTKGIYLLKLDDGTTAKFIKR